MSGSDLTKWVDTSCREHFMTMLQCNVTSHWLCAYRKWSLQLDWPSNGHQSIIYPVALYWVYIIFTEMKRLSNGLPIINPYSFVCILHHIIFMQTYLKVFAIWNACQVYSVEYVSKMKSILSIIFCAIYGTVFAACPFLFWWLWEYLYFILLLSSNQKYESSAIFNVRLWNNDMCCMFYYIFIKIDSLGFAYVEVTPTELWTSMSDHAWQHFQMDFIWNKTCTFLF